MKGCGKGYGTGYGLECGSLTACLVNSSSNICSFCWRIFWGSGTLCAVAGVSSWASSAYTGQYSGCNYHMCSMFVPWLGNYFVGGNSHICCSRARLLGHWHAWKMLLRLLW